MVVVVVMLVVVVVWYLCEAAALESTQLQLIVFEGVSSVFVLCPPETEDGRELLVGALVGESFMNF